MAKINRKNIDLDILDYYDGKIKVYIDDKVGTGGLTIDDSLSDTSTNPVQNKVIKKAFDDKADSNHTHSKSNIIDFPTSLPASDVKAWAKADTKPTYTASEVGADAAGSANTALTSAKSYTDTKIADLINGAPTTLDTLGEIANAMEENQSVVDALDTAIGTKANTSDLNSHTANKSNPHSVTKSQIGLSNVPNVTTNDQTPTFTESTSLTKLTSGEKLSVAFGKISKAITDLISHIGDSVKHITSTERTNWNSAKTHADSAHAPSNAQANIIESIKVNGTALTPSSKAVNITVPSVGNGTITIKQAGTTKGTFTTNQSGNTTIELTDNNTTYGVATTSANGLMSASDKKALDILKNPSATCTTARSDLNKVIALDNFVLSTGTTIAIKFTDTGTSNPASGDITLNINNTGAKSIGYICNGVGVKITSDMGWMFCNGRVHSFRYNGISWECLNYNRDTWRGIQNNLTSDSTTDSLSAAQGKALKALVDGKAASSHKQAYTSDECVNFTSDDGTLGVTPAAVKKAISTFEPKSHTHSSYVNQNAFSNITVGSTTIAADTATDTLTLVGSNVTLTPDATNDKVTIGITKANVTSALGYTPPTTNTTYSSKAAVSGGTDVSLVTTGEKYNWNAKASTAVATTSANGLMSASSLSKLNGIESGAIKVHKALTSNGTTATTTKGYTYGVAGVTTSPYNYTKWYAYLDSGVTTLTNGMIISIKIPVVGCNYGCCISIDGGTTFKPVVYGSNSILTAHFGTNVELLLMYDSSFAASVWSNSSSAAAITGVWRVMNMWDSGNTVSSAMCYTSAGTAAKTATFHNYALLAKSYLLVNIVYSNTAKSALTLNINNRGAKPVHINGAASSSSNYTLPAGTYIAYYDGTNYYFRTDGKIPANISGDATTVNGLTVQTAVPANAKFTDTVYTHPTTSGNKHIPSGGSSGQILRWSADGAAVWGNDNNTTYSNFVKSGSGAKSGLVPAPPTTAGATKYLREDGAWVVPINTWRGVIDNLTTADATKSLSANQGKVLKGLVDGKASSSHTHNAMTGATADADGTSGFVPAPTAGNQDKFLKADGTWSSPPSIGSGATCIVNGTGENFTYEGNYKLFYYNILGIKNNVGNLNFTISYLSKTDWAILRDTDTSIKIHFAYCTYRTSSSQSTINYYLNLSHGKISIDNDNNTLGDIYVPIVTLEIYAV